MQLKLEAAVERLDRAEADLADGRVDLSVQQDEVTDTVNSLYQNGDPELLAFTSLLQAKSPSDLTRQIEANHVLVDSETRVYDDLRAAEVLLEVREQQVEEARDEVAEQRAAAAEHLLEMKDLRNQALEAKEAVQVLVGERRSARQEASRARQHDLGVLNAAAPRGAARSSRRSWPRPAGLPAPAAGSTAPPAASSTVRFRASSPRPSATGGTRSTATGACTTEPTSGSAAVSPSTRRRPAG